MAGPSIGDVLLRIVGDFTGFEADVEKKAAAAGAKGAKSMGKELAAGAGKALLIGFAGAAAIASRGLRELEQVTADYRAETGATAEEAQRAGKAINAMAGRNLQPMEEIGRALTKVKTDMGLAGDAGEKLTEKFLKFGHVTKIDAAAAVVAFDDILDNWGLTADHADEIMNKLIVSHQKYGGSIETNLGTLAKLAPALRGANFAIDDGIALLGLFGSRGLDADQATAAFAKALTKVKSPAELKALIKDIEATKDPFQRASKAADLFGARAGAKLANALGGANLDDFKISMDEAAGATEKAAEVLDNTFGNRLKLLLKGASSQLIEFGSNFGPAVTGLASLASLGGALGGGKVISKIGGPLQKLGVAMGKKVALGLASNAVIGAMAEGLVTVVTGAANAPKAFAASKFAGSKMGKAFGLAFQVAAVFAIAEIADESKPALDKSAADLHDFLFQGPLDDTGKRFEQLGRDLADLPWPLGPKGAPDWARIGNDTTTGLNTAIVKPLTDTALRTQRTGEILAGSVAKGVINGSGAVQSAVNDMVGKTKSPAQHGGLDAGKGYMSAFYRGVTEKQSVVQMALETATQLSKTTMDKAHETAYLLGVLTSKEVAQGVNDKRQDVAAAYRATVDAAIARLEVLAPNTGNLTKKAWNELVKATKSKIPEIAAAAQRIVDRIGTKLGGAKPKAKDAGEKAGGAVATGLGNKTTAVGNAAYRLGETIARNVLSGITHSVAFSQAHHTQPKKPGTAVGGNVPRDRARIVGEFRPEVFVPDTNGKIYPDVESGLAALGGGGGNTTINVPVQGLMPVRSPRDIVTELIRVRDVGILPGGRVTPMYRRPVGT